LAKLSTLFHLFHNLRRAETFSGGSRTAMATVNSFVFKGENEITGIVIWTIDKFF